jgi:hypothetical protein
MSPLLSLLLSQTTLQLDDGTMEQMWSLTAPNAGPDDWIGAAYDPPFEHPFRVASATMFYLDDSCCTGSVCTSGQCLSGADWEMRVIASADLGVDSAGLTPDLSSPVASQSSVTFNGPGTTRTTPPWTLTPDVWSLPGGTIFDRPGRIFYAIKYWSGDGYMSFAVDDGAPATTGYGVHTSDGFATRASIWSFGNVGMRIAVEPVFFLKVGSAPPTGGYQLDATAGVTMLSLRAGGGPSATTVSRVRISASGTGNDATGVASVRLAVDANQNGALDAGEAILASGVFAANDGFVDLTPNRTLAAGAAEEWIVVYDFTSAPSGGQTFRARIGTAADVDSNLGDPYVSGTPAGAGGIVGATITIAGLMAMSLGPMTPPARVVPTGSQGLAALQARLTADDEAFDVTRIRFAAGGTVDDLLEVTSVRLYRDADGSGTVGAGDPILATGAFAADDGAVELAFAPVRINANASQDFLLVIDLSGAATGGDTFRAIVPAAADVVASGVASGPLPASGPRALTGAPIIGNLQTVGGALTAALGAASPPNGTAQPGATNVPMLQFSLTAQAEGVALTALTFQGTGSGDEPSHVARARLHRDANGNGVVDAGDALVGLPQSFAADDGAVTFSVTGETVPVSTTRTYLLSYDFTALPTGGQTFAASIGSAAAILASGQASGAPIPASGTFPLAGGTRTLLGGLSIALAPENPPPRNVQPQSADVPMIALLVAAQGESFAVSSVALSAAGSLDDAADLALVELWRDQGTLGVRDGADVLLDASSFGADDGTATFLFARTVAAGTTERWLVTYDLDPALGAGRTFRSTVAGVVATGSLTGPASASGVPAQGNLMTIGGSLMVALGPASPTGGVIGPSAAGVPMLQIRLSATYEPITISGLTIAAAGTGNDASAIAAASLWVDADRDGELDAIGDLSLGLPRTFAMNDGWITFAFAPRTIGAGASEDWLVAYDLAPTPMAGDTFQVGFAADTDVAASAPSGALPRASGAPVWSGTKTVLGSFAVARGPQSPGSRTVRRDGIDVPVVQLRLTSIGEAFAVTGLRFLAAGSADDVSDVAAVRILRDVDGDGAPSAADVPLFGPATFAGDDGPIAFAGAPLTVPANAGVDLLAVADFAGTAAGGATFRLNLPAPSDVTASGLGGRSAAPSGPPLGSDTLTMGGTLGVGLGVESPIARIVLAGETGISALQLRLTADVEPATITSLVLDTSGTGHDATGLASIDLVLDADGDGLAGAGEPILASGAPGADDGSVAFALSLPVQVGPAVHILALVSMTASPVGGETFQLSIDPGTGVLIGSASGAVMVAGTPVQGATLTAGGGFEIGLGPQASPGALVNQALQGVPVLQLELRSVNEACTVDALRLRAAGSIDDAADVAAVRLVRDANDNGVPDFADAPIGVALAFTEDDGEVVFTGLQRAIGTNASERWLVVYDLGGSAENLETFSIRLEDDDDVTVTCTVSGPVRASGAPIESAIFTIQEDGALVMTRGAESPPPLFIPRGSIRAPVLQLRAASSVQDLTLSSLVVTASVSAGPIGDTIARVTLFDDVNQDGLLDRGDRAVGTGGAPDAVGRVTFAALSLPIPVAEAGFLIAAADISERATPGVTFSIGISSDGDASATSAFGTAVTTGAPIFGEVMTVAGHLSLGGSALSDRIVHNDDDGIVALDVTVVSSWETFRLRSLTLTAEGSMDPSSAVTAIGLFSDEDGDGALGAADRTVAAGLRFPEGAARATFAGLDEAVVPGSPRRFLIAVDLDGTAAVGEISTLSIAANVDVAAIGDRAGLVSPVGAPITGARLEVGSSLEIRPGAPLADTVVAASAERVPALSLEAAAFNESVTITRLTLATTGSLDDATGVLGARLLRDADGDGAIDPEDAEVSALARPAGDDGAITFSPLAEPLSANERRRYLVSLDLSGAGRAGDAIAVSLASDGDVTAFGSVSGAIAATGAPITGPRIALVGALNVRLGPSSPIGVGVEPGTAFGALQIEAFTQGEAVTIDRIALVLEGTADDGRAIAMGRLYRDLEGDGDPILGNARPDGDDGRMTFDGVGLSIDTDASELLLVELEIASDAELGGTARVMLAAGGDVRATGAASGPVETVGAPLVGSSFTIVDRRVGDTGPIDEGCGCTTTPAAHSVTGLLLLVGLARRARCKPGGPRV